MLETYRHDPILRPVLAYWAHKRGTEAMPAKRDIDPVDLPRALLPHLQLIDVVDGGVRFRYRLIGTALVQAYGKDYTGTYADQLVSGERLDFIHQAYRTVVSLKTPVFSHNRYLTVRGPDLIADRVYMPLTDNESEVRYIFGALSFTFGDSEHNGVWGSGRLEPAEQAIEPIDVGAPIAA